MGFKVLIVNKTFLLNRKGGTYSSPWSYMISRKIFISSAVSLRWTTGHSVKIEKGPGGSGWAAINMSRKTSEERERMER